MTWKFYCRHCGERVYPDDNVGIIHCYNCDRAITKKDIITGYTRDARITQLKAMHTLMAESNDEEIYMSWIYLMPDCPTEDDFVDIASSDEMYADCCSLFVKLISDDGWRW